MAKYIGYVEIIDDFNHNTHFNFRPLAEVVGQRIEILSMERLANLFPKVGQNVSKRCLELSYTYSDDVQRNQLCSYFSEDVLMVLDFLITEKEFDDRKYKNYKTDAFKVYKQGNIKKIQETQYFPSLIRIISRNEISPDFCENTVAQVFSHNISDGEKVFVELDSLLAGPYLVKQEGDHSFFIHKNTHTISGYRIDSNSLLDTKNIRYVLCSALNNDHIEVMCNNNCDAHCNSLENNVVVDREIPGEDILPSLLEPFPVTTAEEEKKEQLQQEIDELELAIACKKQEFQKLSKEVDEEEKEKRKLETLKEYLNDEIAEAKKKGENIKKEWEDATNEVQEQFKEKISAERAKENILDTAIDGFIASVVLQAAAKWEAEESDKKHKDLVGKIHQVSGSEFTTAELVKYLCDMVHTVRSGYSENTILNIAICMTQGFLTVFSGEPGCGKTSICNIFGEVLGLNQIAQKAQEIDAPEKETEEERKKRFEPYKRYISVSVERGWTSKRDFVGYYNPLSKTFDKSNRKVYDALHLLHTEKEEGKCTFPCVILLDEANLSPMEYYWSDFMNLCDELDSESYVNLGEEYIFKIPETLHFVATINNDDTTERLSPRLIDRAWIVSLPPYDGTLEENTKIPSEQLKIVPWSALKEAFSPTSTNCDSFPEEIYTEIINHLKKARITVNARTDRAIRQYWAVASQHFVSETIKDKTDGREVEVADTNMLALDYAVMQKLLPKISGNDSNFEEFLKGFAEICDKHSLKHSEGIIYDIIARGKYGYYNFFH